MQHQPHLAAAPPTVISRFMPDLIVELARLAAARAGSSFAPHVAPNAACSLRYAVEPPVPARVFAPLRARSSGSLRRQRTRSTRRAFGSSPACVELRFRCGPSLLHRTDAAAVRTSRSDRAARSRGAGPCCIHSVADRRALRRAGDRPRLSTVNLPRLHDCFYPTRRPALARAGLPLLLELRIYLIGPRTSLRVNCDAQHALPRSAFRFCPAEKASPASAGDTYSTYARSCSSLDLDHLL